MIIFRTFHTLIRITFPADIHLQDFSILFFKMRAQCQKYFQHLFQSHISLAPGSGCLLRTEHILINGNIQRYIGRNFQASDQFFLRTFFLSHILPCLSQPLSGQKMHSVLKGFFHLPVRFLIRPDQPDLLKLLYLFQCTCNPPPHRTKALRKQEAACLYDCQIPAG